MKALSRVLCAVDIDEPGRAAFAQALALARVHDAKLLLVCAVPSNQPFNWQATERVSYLLGMRARAEAAGLDVRVLVQSGNAADIVRLHARSRRPDLIVISAEHGRATGHPAGSIAEDVLRTADCPTLVVRTDSGPAAPAFTNVVCAIDLSAPLDGAVERMLPLVYPRDHRVTLLHVLPGYDSGTDRAVTDRPDPNPHAGRGATALQHLQTLIPSDRTGSVIARVSVGSVAGEILAAARTSQADLIVVGARARSRVGRRLFGVTRQLLLDARCAVLALPVADRASTGDTDRRAA